MHTHKRTPAFRPKGRFQDTYEPTQFSSARKLPAGVTHLRLRVANHPTSVSSEQLPASWGQLQRSR